MRYAFFVGCTTLARLDAYEVSTRRVANRLGMELVDMPGSSCCGTSYLEALDKKTSLALAARNICIGEEMGLDIATVCNGCTEVLTRANNALREDGMLRDEVNGILRETGKRFHGSVKIKHFSRMLLDDVGAEKIKSMVKTPLKGLRVAAHYGCHALRPYEVMRYDDPEAPVFLDKLVELTGASSVPYPGKLDCCAAPIIGVREDVTWSIAYEKVQRAEKYADILVTICPFCFIAYERCQLTETRSRLLPVLHYPQLLGLSMGMGFDELAVNRNRIDASAILASRGDDS